MSALTIIDLYAEWCGPCKAMDPILEKIRVKYPDVEVQKVNIDTEDLTPYGSVTAVPTYIFQRGGEEVLRHTGAIPFAYLEKLVEKYKEQKAV